MPGIPNKPIEGTATSIPSKTIVGVLPLFSDVATTICTYTSLSTTSYD